MIDKLRAISKSLPDSSAAFLISRRFIFVEVDLRIISHVVSSLGWMMIAITISLFFFLPSHISLMILICVTMTVADVIGILVLAGLSMNMSTYSVLVMSIGLCI